VSRVVASKTGEGAGAGGVRWTRSDDYNVYVFATNDYARAGSDSKRDTGAAGACMWYAEPIPYHAISCLRDGVWALGFLDRGANWRVEK